MQIASNFFMAVLIFLIQPTFLVGLIIAIGTSYQRIKTERSNHRVAIYKAFYEVKNYLLLGLVTGLIGSLLSIGIGFPITLDWIIVYQVVTILLMLVGYRFVHPLFAFSLTTLVLIGGAMVGTQDTFNFLPAGWYRPLTQMQWVNTSLITNVLFITVFLLAMTLVTLSKHATKQLSPRFLNTKRGKKIARYQIKPFWVVPLLLIIPGESFGAFFDWWPVFAIGNQTYSFFWLPILMGFRFTVQSQMPKAATELIVKDLAVLTVVAGLTAIGSIWTSYSGFAGLILLIVGGAVVLYRHRQREKKWTFLFGPSDSGIKVIGVRPDTPAEKMELTVGDTLVSCNDHPLATEEDFHQALSSNSVYCRLKVKGPDGELRLTETALYADSPHEIGLVLLHN
ncbi:PDZ domain-containing protein [Carnobacterium sp. CS13]|uniref:PDZ domain-containing protein n=1 Tax=Carnobacterium sp. CS13 TaxID=2800128 RepID=UPI0019149921|nr:PDZ domain-containing protein [Carnobacterium sp. CS13]QQP70613.1 PDZ domain-containing protein [Carnobacterium sp. CS13]